MKPTATFLNRIDQFLHSISEQSPRTETSALLVRPYNRSNEMIEILGSLHSDQCFLDYTIHLEGGDELRINRLVACMMSDFIYTKETSDTGREMNRDCVDMPDVTLDEIRLLIAIVFRTTPRITRSVLCRLILIADEYQFPESIRKVLEPTDHVGDDTVMTDSDTNAVNPDVEMTDEDAANGGSDGGAVHLKIHNGSDDMIECLNSLCSMKKFLDYEIVLENAHILPTNKLVMCMMSRTIRMKCLGENGTSGSKQFNMPKVDALCLDSLIRIGLNNRVDIQMHMLDQLIDVAVEYEFIESLYMHLRTTKNPNEKNIGGVYISECPESFQPKCMCLEINSIQINVRQIVPLLLNGVHVEVRGSVLTLESLKWNASTHPGLGFTHCMEYVEVAQQLKGLRPKAVKSSTPKSSAYYSISHTVVPHVAYDLIAYGLALEQSGIRSQNPPRDFDPQPPYVINVRGRLMNIRRLIPFIIYAMCDSYSKYEQQSTSKKSLEPCELCYDGKLSKWTLTELNVVSQPPLVKLYHDMALLSLKKNPSRLSSESVELYQEILTGHVTGFYNPIQDLISFGRWLVNNSDNAFKLN